MSLRKIPEFSDEFLPEVDTTSEVALWGYLLPGDRIGVTQQYSATPGVISN